jgi:hypothetical protein
MPRCAVRLLRRADWTAESIAAIWPQATIQTCVVVNADGYREILGVDVTRLRTEPAG